MNNKLNFTGIVHAIGQFQIAFGLQHFQCIVSLYHAEFKLFSKIGQYKIEGLPFATTNRQTVIIAQRFVYAFYQFYIGESIGKILF